MENPRKVPIYKWMRTGSTPISGQESSTSSMVPTLYRNLYRSPGRVRAPWLQDISEKGDLLKKCFAGSRIGENEERGLVSNMWCMVLSQNGDNDYLIRKWSSGILYLHFKSWCRWIHAIYCMNRPNLASHGIPVLLVRCGSLLGRCLSPNALVTLNIT